MGILTLHNRVVPYIFWASNYRARHPYQYPYIQVRTLQGYLTRHRYSIQDSKLSTAKPGYYNDKKQSNL